MSFRINEWKKLSKLELKKKVDLVLKKWKDNDEIQKFGNELLKRM